MSFPASAPSSDGLPSPDRAAIAALENRLAEALRHKDLDALMAVYAPRADLLVFTVAGDSPASHEGAAELREYWHKTFTAADGPIDVAITDLAIEGDRNFAFGHHLQHYGMNLGASRRLDMLIRVTTAYRKIGARWLIVQEHDSLPISVVTGKAVFVPTAQNEVAPRRLPSFHLPVAANGIGEVSDTNVQRPLFITFFASWCLPCRSEAPAITALAERYSKLGVATIGIDVGENTDVARSFAAQYHFAFPVLEDRDQSLLLQFSKNGAIPCGVFVDENGHVVSVITGALTAEEAERHLASIAARH